MLDINLLDAMTRAATGAECGPKVAVQEPRGGGGKRESGARQLGPRAVGCTKAH